MKRFKTEDFEIVLKLGKPMILEWIGHCHFMTHTSIIDPFLSDVIDELEGKEVIVDFTQLTFMNSSSVFSVINMCKKLENKAIPTRIVYDGTKKWQTVTFSGLARLAKVMKHVSVDENEASDP